MVGAMVRLAPVLVVLAATGVHAGPLDAEFARFYEVDPSRVRDVTGCCRAAASSATF